MGDLIRLKTYRGYEIYVTSNGWFAAYSGEEEAVDHSASVASSEAMKVLMARVDAIENTTKRDRIRPVVNVITSNGYRGVATGIHAGTGRPNIKMNGTHGGDGKLYYDVPEAQVKVLARIGHLKDVRDLDEALKEYELPHLSYGRAVQEDVTTIEAQMKSRWEELNPAKMDAYVVGIDEGAVGIDEHEDDNEN